MQNRGCGRGIRRAALAFPLHLPGRPEKSRAAELNAVKFPTLVLQGKSDPFGMPRGSKTRKVVRLAGTHSLASDMPGLRDAVSEFLVPSPARPVSQS